MDRNTLKKWYGAFCIGMAFFSAGCNKKSPQANSVSVQAAPAWDWAKYPKSNRFQLALLPADLSAAKMYRYVAPTAGVLHVNIDQPEIDLEEGFIWAAMDQDNIKSEELSLALMEKNIELKERQSQSMELPKQRLEAERALEEGRRKLMLMEMVYADQDLMKLASDHIDASVTEVNETALSRCREEVKILEAALEAVRERIQGDNLEAESKRMELEQRQNDFKRKCAQSRMQAPFAGRLAANIQFSGQKRDFPVGSSQELGVLRDVSKLQFSLPLTYSSWLQIPAESLEIIAPQGLEAPLKATYESQRIEQRQGIPEQRVYTFSLSEEQSRNAYRLLGSRLQAELWMALDQTAYLVPKVDVAIYGGGKMVGRRWDEAIDLLFPGARLLAEGQTHLAIAGPLGEAQRQGADLLPALEKEDPNR